LRNQKDKRGAGPLTISKSCGRKRGTINVPFGNVRVGTQGCEKTSETHPSFPLPLWTDECPITTTNADDDGHLNARISNPQYHLTITTALYPTGASQNDLHFPPPHYYDTNDRHHRGLAIATMTMAAVALTMAPPSQYYDYVFI
jgi:hypothetical protein